MERSLSSSAKQLAIGVFFFITFNTIIKLVVYPTIIYLSKSIFMGLIFMFLSSFTLRYLLILFYDLIKIDWLLIESLKARREHKSNHITRRIKKLKKIGNISLLTTLVCTDSVITVLYFRQGYFDWNGFKGVDIKILFVISNLICTLSMGGIINLIFKIF